jgi:hypothetical protein
MSAPSAPGELTGQERQLLQELATAARRSVWSDAFFAAIPVLFYAGIHILTLAAVKNMGATNKEVCERQGSFWIPVDGVLERILTWSLPFLFLFAFLAAVASWKLFTERRRIHALLSRMIPEAR